jgi:hypothetical protein
MIKVFEYLEDSAQNDHGQWNSQIPTKTTMVETGMMEMGMAYAEMMSNH